VSARKVSLGVLTLLLCASQGFGIAGVWRRTAVRTTAVVATTAAVASSSAAAAQQSAAAASQASAAAAQAAAKAAAPAPAAPADKTPQQKLEALQSLYKQGLISESDYNAAKAKILAELAQ
jgi:membrane protease subunit (stomatin/prohibitin family)